jgi:pimeloyl-ACP methyl ester carboxylesterase
VSKTPVAATRLLLWSATLAVALAFTSASGQATHRSRSHQPSPRYHVYLFRGLVPMMSSGMVDMATALQRLGINASVHNQSDWQQVAEKTVVGYRHGNVRNIIVVGYSAGAAAATNMAARLGEHGVPVKLAITLDPVWSISAPGLVDRYVNYYSSYGGHSVKRSKQFRGTLQNVDVRGIRGLGHLNIDNNKIVQHNVIRDIRAVIHGDHRAASPGTILVSGLGRDPTP